MLAHPSVVGSFVANGDAVVCAHRFSGTDHQGVEHLVPLQKFASEVDTRRSSFLDAVNPAPPTRLEQPLNKPNASAPQVLPATQWLGDALAYAGTDEICAVQGLCPEGSPARLFGPEVSPDAGPKMVDAPSTPDHRHVSAQDAEGTSTAVASSNSQGPSSASPRPSDNDFGSPCADDGSEGSTIVLDEDDREVDDALDIESDGSGDGVGSAVIVLSDSEGEQVPPPSIRDTKCQRKKGNKIALQPQSDPALHLLRKLLRT